MSATPFTVPGEVAWVRSRTVVRCYDDDGREVVTLDGVTGLTWALDGAEWTVDESVLPPGRWVFDGVYLTGLTPLVERRAHVVHVEGVAVNDGSGFAELLEQLEGLAVSPWEYVPAPRIYTLWGERESRMGICRACPLYDHVTGTCTIDDSFMADKTKHSGEVCPDDPARWGLASNYDEAEAAIRAARSVNMVPVEAVLAGLPDDQQTFEDEWEAHRAGR